MEEPEDDGEDWEDLDSDDDDEKPGDLAERLAEIDLNNADEVWARLTDEEKQEFKSIVHNGEIEKIVQPVEPWWKLRLEEKLVKDLAEDSEAMKKILKNIPAVSANIKDFKLISAKTPAPCIIYNIANVIGAYTYVFHYFNGDHHSYELEATDSLISICENLKSNANFESIAAVADSIMLNCHNLDLFSDLNTRSMILSDLEEIFEGPGDENHSNAFILSALSDILQLLKVAKSNNRKENSREASATSGTRKFSAEFLSSDSRREFKQLENKTHLTGCQKKIEFYLSFVNSRYKSSEWPIMWNII